MQAVPVYFTMPKNTCNKYYLNIDVYQCYYDFLMNSFLNLVDNASKIYNGQHQG